MMAMRDIEQNMSHTDDLIEERKTSQKKKPAIKADKGSVTDQIKTDAIEGSEKAKKR